MYRVEEVQTGHALRVLHAFLQIGHPQRRRVGRQHRLRSRMCLECSKHLALPRQVLDRGLHDQVDAFETLPIDGAAKLGQLVARLHLGQNLALHRLLEELLNTHQIQRLVRSH